MLSRIRYAEGSEAECRASLDRDRYWLHKFRATFATMHLVAGVALRTDQAWLGHPNLKRRFGT